MLGGEDLGRRHEGGLPAVLRRERAQRRGNDRLARADVALHQPVHRPAGYAVRRDLLDRAALRAGGGEGQRVQICRQPAGGKDDAGVRLSALFELLQAAAQQEQLLEHHAAARRGDVLRRLRPVDGGERVRRVRQTVFGAQQFGQRVGPVARHRGERGVGHALQIALGQPGGQRIDRHDAAGVVRIRRDLFRLRGDERAAAAEALHPAVEHIFLPHAQQGGGIGIVEPGDVQRAGFVKNGALNQSQPLADAADPGFSAHDRADRVLILRADVRDAGEHRAVLIVAGIGLKRVAQRADMQFCKQLCLFRADALDKLDAVVECRHGKCPQYSR